MKVTVVGAGPVGTLGAITLARKGHHVEVYESRCDPRSKTETHGRSLNLSISNRGLDGLERAGLKEIILSKSVYQKGRMIHNWDGSTKTVLYDCSNKQEQKIYSLSRDFLNKTILEEAEKYENIKVHFNLEFFNADLDKGVSTFRSNKVLTEPSNTFITTQSDVIIGADGAHSAVRQQILKRPISTFSQKYIDHGYIELYIPPCLESQKHVMDEHYVHIWPRREFLLMALANLDGSFAASLFMPFPMFAKLNTSELISSFFEIQFPDIWPHMCMKSAVETILCKKPSALISIQCWPYHCGRAVLVGDAAHAMVPFFAQGVNAGFEDLIILEDIFEKYGAIESIENCLSLFTETRCVDAHAISQLAMNNYEEMRCSVTKKSFFIRKNIDDVLHKTFGDGWVPLYKNVAFSRRRYSHCLKHREWQDKLLKILLTGIVIITILSTVLSLAYRQGNDHLQDGQCPRRLMSNSPTLPH